MNQRWRNGRDSYRVPDEVATTEYYETSEIGSDSVVKQFCRVHHYLKSAGPPSRFQYGLYRHGELVGVTIFSHPTNGRAITEAFRCSAVEGVELSRLVLLDDVPANGES